MQGACPQSVKVGSFTPAHNYIHIHPYTHPCIHQCVHRNNMKRNTFILGIMLSNIQQNDSILYTVHTFIRSCLCMCIDTCRSCFEAQPLQRRPIGAKPSPQPPPWRLRRGRGRVAKKHGVCVVFRVMMQSMVNTSPFKCCSESHRVHDGLLSTAWAPNLCTCHLLPCLPSFGSMCPSSALRAT